MSKKIIYQSNLQELRPLIWYGQPVHDRYKQLRKLLIEGLGEEYGDLLAEPIVQSNSGKASWLSDVVPNGVEFTKLSPDVQERVRTQLQNIISKVKQYASQLKNSSDPHQKELGELLEQAIEVPGFEYVIVDGAKIVMVAWGFSSDKSRIDNFRIEAKVSKPIVPDINEDGIVATPSLKHSEPTTSSSTESTTTTTSSTPPPPPYESSSTEHTEHTENTSQTNISSQQTPPSPPPPPTSDGDNKKRRGLPGWLWFLLGVIFAVLVFLLIRACNSDDPNNHHSDVSENQQYQFPSAPNVIPPVDTTKIIQDPDDPGNRKVLSDKVNVALARHADCRKFASDLYEKYGNNVEVVFYDTAILLLQVQVPDGEFRPWIDSIKTIPNVKLAFPNTLFSNSVINFQDPGFSDNKQSWYFDPIEAPVAWDITTGDSSVIVAVCDNGFDLNHKELSGKIVNPYNVTTGNSDVHVISTEGNFHGTHVAGTAVGNSNNGGGVCGIAPNCRLMPIQIADDNGNMQAISVVAGILYAIHHDAKVVNLSLGLYFGDIPQQVQQDLLNNYYLDEAEFYNELFQFAIDEDVVLVLAAGNENILAGVDPFSRSSKVLVVSAVEPQKASHKANFSNFGQYSNISAPGVNIYSSKPNNNYGYSDGTSMAAPIVTGAAALLKSKFPNLKAKDIISILRQTAKEIPNDPKIGPLVQIAKALNMASGGQLLEIPSDAQDLSFAEGNWRSTTELNKQDNNDIEIVVTFNIKMDGTGTITYHESTGDIFEAPINVTFQDGKLIMVQSENATSQNSNSAYNPCTMTCTQQTNGAAKCGTKYEDQDEIVEFQMVKINY